MLNELILICSGESFHKSRITYASDAFTLHNSLQSDLFRSTHPVESGTDRGQMIVVSVAMCRPSTTTRTGFTESQGTGVHIIMSARSALKLGAPTCGGLVFTSTST